MNQRQYAASANLSIAQLHEDKGAFFGSVFGSLNHIMVGDIIWLKRFALHPSSSESLSYIRTIEKPENLNSMLFTEFGSLKKQREKLDDIILNWVMELNNVDIRGCLTYTDMTGNSFNKPLASLIHHLFLHQVHHRGQVTTLLSQYGVDFGETDIIEIINDCDDNSMLTTD